MNRRHIVVGAVVLSIGGIVAIRYTDIARPNCASAAPFAGVPQPDFIHPVDYIEWFNNEVGDAWMRIRVIAEPESLGSRLPPSPRPMHRKIKPFMETLEPWTSAECDELSEWADSVLAIEEQVLEEVKYAVVFEGTEAAETLFGVLIPFADTARGVARARVVQARCLEAQSPDDAARRFCHRQRALS